MLFREMKELCGVRDNFFITNYLYSNRNVKYTHSFASLRPCHRSYLIALEREILLIRVISDNNFRFVR